MKNAELYLHNSGISRLAVTLQEPVVINAPFVGDNVMLNIDLEQADGKAPLAVNILPESIAISRPDAEPYGIVNAHYASREEDSNWEDILRGRVPFVRLCRQSNARLWTPEPALLPQIMHRNGFQFFINQVVSGVAFKQSEGLLSRI